MANSYTDYLRFDAASIKELITNKLNESGAYTDQLYEGSNLTILIDIFAYMYDTLTYVLNNAASESVFIDAQLYENMNRLAKMLGYNPAGYITSSVVCDMSVNGTYPINGITTIPKFTSVETDLTDSAGNKVKFSFVENYSFVVADSSISSNFQPVLYNGEWKKYSGNFITEGIAFETVTLSNLVLNGTDRIYLSHGHIYVYEKKVDGTYSEWTPISNLYNAKSTEKRFELRLNESYQYVLKFGDSIYGQKIGSGSELIIVYLESNGTAGVIEAGSINANLELSTGIEGISSSDLITYILQYDLNPDFIDLTVELPYIRLTNSSVSTSVSDFEDVESIRENAPNAFRIGSRLITENDFEQYTLANYTADIYDIQVMNNWKYMTSFMEWLRLNGKLDMSIRQYYYSYCDSCDFNNVYLWVKSYSTANVSDSVKKKLLSDINRIKPLTSEPVVLDPFMLSFSPYVSGSYDKIDFDTNYENKIEITRDRNTLVTVERIKQKAVQILQNYFSVTNCNLGMTVSVDSLYNQLLSIDGVKSVVTKYLPTGGSDAQAIRYQGLSLALWTPHILNGVDFVIITGNYGLKEFQFPYLYDSSNIINRIDIISDNYNISEVEY